MNAVLNFLKPAAPVVAAPTLSELIVARIAAKRVEDDAIEARRAIDTQLADALRDPAKPEGAISRKEGDFKLTVTYGITRKVDTDALQKVWHSLSEDQHGTFKWGADVRVGELKKLPEADRVALAKFIESKPSSPSVKIDFA